jgi:hypothetical protein
MMDGGELLGTGREFWFMTLARLTMYTVTAMVFGAYGSAVAQSLDYDYFKANVQPIFLKKRVGHARCVVCHAESNNAFRLQGLPAGSTEWTEEQTRKNFEAVKVLVKPGDPNGSHFLKHPLAPEAGGDEFHNGGHQFPTRDDPDWKTIAEWVRGAK